MANRLKTAYYSNMGHDGGSVVSRTQDGKRASFLLRAIDGGEAGAGWGRLHMDVSASPSVVYVVHAFALDNKSFLRKGTVTGVEEFMTEPDTGADIKREFLSQIGGVTVNCQNDILLYQLSGRYLWIYVEVWGDGAFALDNMRVDVIGDNFMAAFPEVYQERGSFFHRYISVFSSMYNDFSDKVNNVHRLLDVDRADVSLLEEYAAWFGIDIRGGFLSEERMRLFMHEIFDLVKCKGTRECLERVAQIALGERPVIIERNLLDKEGSLENRDVIDELYGDSPLDVLVLTTVRLEEQKKAQLFYFLEQFKPVRCHMNIIFLKEHGEMDKYTYLGMNARLTDVDEGSMDDSLEMDGNIAMG